MSYTKTEKERAVNETLKFLKSLREDPYAYMQFLRFMGPPTDITLRDFAKMIAKLFKQEDDLKAWVAEAMT